MASGLRVIVVVLFWLIQVWWIGSVVRGFQSASEGGTFRVLSVFIDGERHDGWGLTFHSEPGQALAATYIVLIGFALLGATLSCGMMWALSAVVLTAWATLFAGNTIWLSQWSSLQWWDGVTIGGWLIVVSHLSVMAPSRLRCSVSKASSDLETQ